MGRIISTGAIFFAIIVVTITIILYGRGYRFNLKEKEVRSTGALVATSSPLGAQVFVNGTFTTATNSTTQLAPGDYKVRIVKAGYIPWEKDIKIQPEVVSKADAVLFPSSPSLSALTSTGVIKPQASPDGSKIIFMQNPESTPSAQAPNETPAEGIWLLDLSERPLGLNRDPKQIALSTVDRNWADGELVWSPTGKQVLAVFTQAIPKSTKSSLAKEQTARITRAYLLETDRLNSLPTDVTAMVNDLLRSWDTQRNEKNREKLLAYPKEIVPIATSSTRLIAFSPDETKFLYQATASATLPPVIIPPLLGTDPTAEQRTISPGKLYVYDAKEDKNFFIMNAEVVNKKQGDQLQATRSPMFYSPFSTLNASPTLQWYPDSNHLVLLEGGHIILMDYDGINRTTVYGGPFANNFLAPWPGGGKLVILTNLNSTFSDQPNLYLVNLR